MRKVYYMVGKDGYYTRCNTWASAQKQKEQNAGYEIITCFEKIKE